MLFRLLAAPEDIRLHPLMPPPVDRWQQSCAAVSVT
jgi:hypothetical protein